MYFVIGNVYIADYTNHRIRKVTISTGIVTTIAGTGTNSHSGDGGPATSAALSYPVRITLDSSGNIFFTDTYNQRIRKITLGGSYAPTSSPSVVPTVVPTLVPTTGSPTITPTYYPSLSPNSITVITTIAGTGTGSFSGDGGKATSATIQNPTGIALDSSGNVFFCDDNNQRIRKITVATGIITTYAGTGSFGFSGDNGQATSAVLYYPEGLVIDSSGELSSLQHPIYHLSYSFSP